MRNSPPIPRTHGAIFRNASPPVSTLSKSGGGPSASPDEVLSFLVFQLCLQRRRRQWRIEQAKDRLHLLSPLEASSIEIGEVPENFFEPSLDEEPEPVEEPEVLQHLLSPLEASSIEIGEVPENFFEPSLDEEPEPVEEPEVLQLDEVTKPFGASWNILGQYVNRILDRRARSLRKYVEARAFTALARARRREREDPDFTARSFEEYYFKCRIEIAREVHDLVSSGRWLSTPTRDPRDSICMSRAKNGKQVFLLVRHFEEGGGKVLAVYETSRFNRVTHQHGRRGYRNVPPTRH